LLAAQSRRRAVNAPSQSSGSVEASRAARSGRAERETTNGAYMEPKSRVKRSDSQEQSIPASTSATETEDYFELAYEIDEFGVHVPEFLSPG
jgi:hypothetical protein